MRSGYTSLSDSVLEPGGAYPANELQREGEDEGESTAARPITHVNHFTLKYDEHHALCTAHIPGGIQRSTYQSPNCSTGRPCTPIALWEARRTQTGLTSPMADRHWRWVAPGGPRVDPLYVGRGKGESWEQCWLSRGGVWHYGDGHRPEM